MKRLLYFAAVAVLLTAAAAKFTPTKDIVLDQRPGITIVPDASIERPSDIGVRMHTNTVLFVPAGAHTDSSSPQGETPASLACVYQLVTPVSGCPISGTSLNPTGGAKAVAIVDAYDDPNIESDLGVFSTQFGLPSCTKANGCFSQVYASGRKPAKNAGWDLEISLDVEWAHAMAPNAKIILVEASSSTNAALYQAEDVAGSMVAALGGGEVSNSWGGSETSNEASSDSHFKVANVVYFASSGDTGGAVIYPSASPFVVSAGGTHVGRSGGNFTSETGWSGSGGGPSKYEGIPSYQSVISSIVGTKRGTPDFSFDADPNTGVSIYDTVTYQGLSKWIVIGGTSVASPSLGGLVNAAGSFYSNSNTELTEIYNNFTNPSYFRDITSGSAGKYSCMVGWDYVTGVGSDLTYTDK